MKRPWVAWKLCYNIDALPYYVLFLTFSCGLLPAWLPTGAASLFSYALVLACCCITARWPNKSHLRQEHPHAYVEKLQWNNLVSYFPIAFLYLNEVAGTSMFMVNTGGQVSWDVALQCPMAGTCAALKGISSQECEGERTGGKVDYSQLFGECYAFLQTQSVRVLVLVPGSQVVHYYRYWIMKIKMAWELLICQSFRRGEVHTQMPWYLNPSKQKIVGTVHPWLTCRNLLPAGQIQSA